MASTSPPPAPVPPHPAAPRPRKESRELTIISHSNLYYWWPVWAFGFIMAIITYFEGYVMAVMPISGPVWAVVDAQGTRIQVFPESQKKEAEDYAAAKMAADKGLKLKVEQVREEIRSAVDADITIETHTQDENGEHISKESHADQVVVYVPQSGDKDHVGVPFQSGTKAATPPYLRVSPHKGLGVAFLFILLMVVLITNVPLRGMWSVLIIVVAVALVVIFIAVGWIETILGWFYLLDMRINMGGYMTISLFLFIIWLIALLGFDKQRYVTVTPGEVRVCEQIGGGEQVYGTVGMTFKGSRAISSATTYSASVRAISLFAHRRRHATSTCLTCCSSVPRCARSTNCSMR